MRKVASTAIDRHSAPQGRAGGRIALLLICVLTTPLLIDGAKLCYVQWASIFGPMPVVRTPTIDLIGSYVDETLGAAGRLAKLPFRRVPWRPQWAVTALVVSLVAGTLVMRHGRLK